MIRRREQNLKSAQKATLTINEAAKFLGVSLNRINELVLERKLRMWEHNGKKYFLGGELDFCKLTMRPQLPILSSEPTKFETSKVGS